MLSERKTIRKKRMLRLAAIIAVVAVVLFLGLTILTFVGTKVSDFSSTSPEGMEVMVGSVPPPTTASPRPPAAGNGGSEGSAAASPAPDLHALVRDELKKLSPGRVLFNPPTEMRQGDRERVEVRITKDMDVDLKAGLAGRGVPEVESIKVNTFMRVRMFGNGFDVTPKSDEEQFVGETDYTEWLFDVLPVESGRKILELLVTVRIKLPDGEEVRNLPVKHRKINVEVDPWWVIKGFVSAHWKWFLGGIAGAVAGVIGFFGKRYFA